jgi:serine/threonine protein phosphatase PrpC
VLSSWLKRQKYHIEWSGASIQGERAEQQDAFQVVPIPDTTDLLLVLADGMGGHSGGAIASRTVVATFVSKFLGLRKGSAEIQVALRTAMEEANVHLRTLQLSDSALSDMGSTLIAAYLSPASLAWISVGDSPMWLLRDNKLVRLNEDHSLRSNVQAAEKFGSVLISALNGQPPPLVDCPYAFLPLFTGDRLIAASDGVFTLGESEIAAILQGRSGNLSRLVFATLEEVEKRGKNNQDNCTLILAEVIADAGPRTREQTSPSAS